jgi:hypothetical protein
MQEQDPIKQALRDFVATSNSGKYKNEDELLSKFPELKSYDKQLLRDFVATSNSGKYKTEDEVFTKFPEFSDVKKKEPLELGFEKPSEALRMGGLPKQEKLSQSPLKTAETTTPSVSTKKPTLEFTTEKPVSTFAVDSKDLALTVGSREDRKKYLGEVRENILGVIEKYPDLYVSQKDKPTFYGERKIPAGTPNVDNISKAIDEYAEKIKRDTGKELSTYDKQYVVKSVVESLASKKAVSQAAALVDLDLTKEKKLPLFAVTGVKSPEGKVVKESVFKEELQKAEIETKKELDNLPKQISTKLDTEFAPELNKFKEEIKGEADLLNNEIQNQYKQLFESNVVQLKQQYQTLVNTGQMPVEQANAEFQQKQQEISSQIQEDLNMKFKPEFDAINNRAAIKTKEIQTKYNRKYKAEFDRIQQRHNEKLKSIQSKYEGVLDKKYFEEYSSRLGEKIAQVSAQNAQKELSDFRNLPTSEKLQKALAAGWSDVLSSVGGAIGYTGLDATEINNAAMQTGLFNPLPAAAFQDKSLKDMLTDTDWWITNGVRALPFTAVTMPISFGGGAATGALARALGATKRAQVLSSVIGGGYIGWEAERFLEAGNSFKEAIDEGKSVSEAAQIAATSSTLQFATLPLNIAQMLPFFGKGFKFLNSAALEGVTGGLEEIIQGWSGQRAKNLQEGTEQNGFGEAVNSFGDYFFSKQAMQEGAIGFAIGQTMAVASSLNSTPDIDKQIHTIMSSLGVGGETQARKVLQLMMDNGAISETEFAEYNNLIDYTLDGIASVEQIPVSDDIKSVLVNKYVGISKARALMTEDENDLASQAAKELIAEKEKEIKEILKGNQPVYLVFPKGTDIPIVTTKEQVEQILKKNPKALESFDITSMNDQVTQAKIDEAKAKLTKETTTDGQTTIEEPISGGTDVTETRLGVAVEPSGEGVTGEGVQAQEVLETPQVPLTAEDIETRRQETEDKIKRKDLFIGVGDFSTELGGSDLAAVPVSHKEKNGIEFVEYAHPKTGSVDVIVTGKSENDFVGFYRIYENGKPTNKWSSKFENQSRNKEDFKTMISGVQEMLPAGHEYTEKTSISTDGLRVWNQQLERGYELQYDENGKLITNSVFINGDAIVNELGIPVDKGNFENIRVTTREDFEKVKSKLLPYLEKFGLDESNIKWISGNVEITPQNEKAFATTASVKIDLPVLKNTNKTRQIPTASNVSETTPTEAAVKPTETKEVVSEKVTEKPTKEQKDLGYHGGNLMSKSDYLTSGYRGDMPFTGHYFFSDRVRAEARGNRTQPENKEVSVVDFSKYNLLKPTTNEYWSIKAGLKRFEDRFLRNGIESAFESLESYGGMKDGAYFLYEQMVKNKEKIQKVAEDWKENELGNIDKKKKIERLETLILKELGYEGIDVRGLKESNGEASPDSSSEGSVIFDLKPESIVESPSKQKEDSKEVVSETVSEKPTKAERKAIAEAKIDDLAAKAKEFLRNKNLPEGTKTSGISQDKVIDVLASTVKALVNSGIEISEAIKQVREYFESDYDTTSIKDSDIEQAVTKQNFQELTNKNRLDFRKAQNLINKYVRPFTEADYASATQEDIDLAKANRDAGKVREGYEEEKAAKEEKKKEAKKEEGEKKLSGRSKSYEEGRVPVGKNYNDAVNEQKVYYEQMNRKEELANAEEYLASFGNTEEGLLDAYDDMMELFKTNPFLDPKNSIAIEVLADRMFAKAMDFKDKGQTDKYNKFLDKSEKLRREAFQAHFAAGQFTSAVAVFSRSANPDAFLIFIDGQVAEEFEKAKTSKPAKVKEYEDAVNEFYEKAKEIKKDAAKQAVISAPKSTTKTRVKLTDKLKARYEQGKKRQEDALKKLGKINFFGSNGLSNEAIEAISELIYSQFEQGIYKAANIIDKIREITENKVPEKLLKEVFDKHTITYKGEKRTLSEVGELLQKEEIAEKESAIDIEAEVAKELEKLAKMREDEQKAVSEMAEAERLKRSQTEAKDIASNLEKDRVSATKEVESLTNAILKENERIDALKEKEAQAQNNRVEALRLKRAQAEIAENVKKLEKERIAKQKEAADLAEAILKEKERIKKLNEKEAQAQSDRILATRLERAKQAVKDQEKKVKDIEAKAKKEAGAKTTEGKRPTLADLIQRELEADSTKEQVANKLMEEGGLSEREANKLAEIYYNKYRQILKEKITSQLLKDLTPKKVKEIEAQMNSVEGKPYGKTLGGMIANEVAAGALDSEILRAAFAEKYGLPSLSPVQANIIRDLSRKARAAKTQLGLQTANKQLLEYVNSVVKPKYGSLLGTLYYMGILTGVSTAAVNTFGNVNGLVNQSTENFVQSVIEAVKGNKGNLMSGTKPAQKILMAIANMNDSLSAAIDILIHGGGESRYSNIKKDAFGEISTEDLIVKRKDFKDLGFKKLFVTLGKLFKTPPALFIRNLPASDEGFTMANFNMEATRELRKKLYAEGYRGAELEKKVYEQVYGTTEIKAQALQEAIKELKRIGVDPANRKLLANRIAKEIITKNLDESVQNVANEVAKENTFRGKPRGMAGYLSKKIPQTWLITPFVTTPSRILEKHMNYIPLYGAARYFGFGISEGLLKIFPALQKDFTRKGIESSKREGELRNKQLAQVLASHALLLALWGLSNIDWEDEEGNVVPFVDASAGYMGTDREERKKLEELMPAYMIRIGNFKFSYKTNPLLAMIALPLGVVKDAERSFEPVDYSKLAFVYNFEIFNFLYESNPIQAFQKFFEGLGKSLRTIKDDMTWENIAELPIKIAADFSSNVAVDNFYKQIVDFTDPDVHEAQDLMEVVYKSWNMEKIGDLTPTHDRWGRPVKRYPGESFFPLQHIFNDDSNKKITEWEIKNGIEIPTINRKTLVLTNNTLKTEKVIENQRKELIKDYGLTSEEVKLFDDALNKDFKLLNYKEWDDMSKTIRYDVFTIIKNNFENTTDEYKKFYKENINSDVRDVKPISKLSRPEAKDLVKMLFEIKKKEYINKNFTKLEQE